MIDPPLNAVGRAVARTGISANAVTLLALLPGLGAAVAIFHGQHGLALALILLNRLADGLDGAVARANGPSDFGGYLDIVSDFVVYTAVPLAFGLAAPANLVPALLLVASFTLTGVSFLAFAAIAARRGEETTAHGRKSFFYSTGLAEGTETIACFIAMCLWPQQFATIALVYAGLCALTVVQRSLMARQQFRRPPQA
ncbi:CDP-alcohol phosphatidyltransferase family protein [Sandarakinorhabdus rubra]|uniref:CDP-alcohol phosphatidyltransferase family protein n=1 Tax=Sandarakinorhabdus rubra TaxID=2672568 RepID=UPI001F32D38D|nr:CDP-alcohol phosphatidyltransferase family protein [Sandarakinorhabdus rubra]